MLSDREVNALRASGKFENIFRELDKADLLNGNNMYGDLLGKSALELYLDFNDQGHSGTSAYATLDIFTRLVKGLPLTPLTGESNEWETIGYEKDRIRYQNKRCSAVFGYFYINERRFEAYLIDGRIFSDDGGKTFYTNEKSNVYIDEFPYYPPTEPERVILKEGLHTNLKEDDNEYSQTVGMVLRSDLPTTYKKTAIKMLKRDNPAEYYRSYRSVASFTNVSWSQRINMLSDLNRMWS